MNQSFFGMAGKFAKEQHFHKELIYAKNIVLAIDGTFDEWDIPPTGTLLKLILRARTDRISNSDLAKVKFNGDGGNTYIGVIQWGGAAPGWTQQTAAGAPFQFTYLPANTSPANWYSHSVLTIPFYAQMDDYKDWQARGMQVLDTGANNWIYDAGGQWQSKSPIERVQIYPSIGTNFKARSALRLRVYA